MDVAAETLKIAEENKDVPHTYHDCFPGDVLSVVEQLKILKSCTNPVDALFVRGDLIRYMYYRKIGNPEVVEKLLKLNDQTPESSGIEDFQSNILNVKLNLAESFIEKNGRSKRLIQFAFSWALEFGVEESIRFLVDKYGAKVEGSSHYSFVSLFMSDDGSPEHTALIEYLRSKA